MGFWETIRLASALDEVPSSTPDVILAADTYYQPSLNTVWWETTVATVSRNKAMTVPAVARARNIICGTVGSLPLERYGLGGQHLPSPPLFYQPDPASPRAVTYAWLADSIMFHGVGYTQVLEVYAEDGRPSRWRWIDPLRVTPRLNDNGTMVLGYQLDGVDMPQGGVGSIIAFPGIEEGLLRRAAGTISTAYELEQAALRAAQEPTPTVVIKSSGPDLPSSKITEILTTWKTARASRSTAFLSSNIDMQPVGFDPKSQQLVEARQFHASEIARAVGIPAWYLNAETASMTYSNTEQERRTLVDFSLRPILSAIEDRLNMPDIQPRGIRVRFDLDDFLRGNAMERAQINQILLTNGVITVEQWQSMEDLSPEGGMTE